MVKNLNDNLPIVKNSLWDKYGLIQFERKMADYWESGKVRGPIHLSGGNEDELIEIFKRIRKTDWVFSTWRSHYHALLKGVSSEWLEKEILEGRSITIINKEEKFYSSGIVAGIKWVFANTYANYSKDVIKEYEQGLPHTRENIILLSKNVLKYDELDLTSTLIHEKIHIYQRYNPELFDKNKKK